MSPYLVFIRAYVFLFHYLVQRFFSLPSPYLCVTQGTEEGNEVGKTRRGRRSRTLPHHSRPSRSTSLGFYTSLSSSLRRPCLSVVGSDDLVSPPVTTPQVQGHPTPFPGTSSSLPDSSGGRTQSRPTRPVCTTPFCRYRTF